MRPGVIGRVAGIAAITAISGALSANPRQSVEIETAAVSGKALNDAPKPLREAAQPAANSISLIDQTSWRVTGQPFAMRLKVATSNTPDQVEIAVTVLPEVSSRSEFNQSIVGKARASAQSFFLKPLAELNPSPDGIVDISIGGPDPASSPLSLRVPGVYPVRVELRVAGGGSVLSGFVTHLINVPPSIEGSKLNVASVFPVHALPALQADGVRKLPAGDASAMSALTQALATHPNLPYTLEPTAESLEALASSSRATDRATLQTLASVSQTKQVLATTFVPMNGIGTPGLEAELADQLNRAGSVNSSLLTRKINTDIWASTDHIDARAVSRLQEAGFNRYVVPESSLVPDPRQNVTLTRPIQIVDDNKKYHDALLADSGITEHFKQTDAPLAAHQLLADLAVIYFDSPGRNAPREVVALPPSEWTPTLAFLNIYADAIMTSPILNPSSLDDVFTNVLPAANRAQRPVVRQLVNIKASNAEPTSNSIRQSRRRLKSFATMLEPKSAIFDALDDQLLVSESSDLKPKQRVTYFKGFQASLDKHVKLVHLPPKRSITLTARKGSIPLSILSAAQYPTKVTLEVQSEKLDFVGGTRRELKLTRPNTTQDFVVSAKTSGTFTVRVRLTSPDGTLLLDQSELTVRSTAASYVGVLLSVGAGTFLLTWWARNAKRVRKNRRLINQQHSLP